MSEKYKPSTEEIKKAEKMMTEKEKRMSDYRESDVNATLRDDLMEKLERGEFELERSGSTEDIKARGSYDKSERGNYISLYGKIGKHEISIDVSTGNQIYASTIDGEVDGKNIDNELARELFNKYLKIANLQDNKLYEERAENEMFWDDQRKREQKMKETPEFKAQQQEENKRKEELNKDYEKREQAEEKLSREKKKKEREGLKDIL